MFNKKKDQSVGLAAMQSLVIPRVVVLSIITICIFPFMMNIGLDFSSAHYAFDLEWAKEALAHEVVDAQFKSLSGAFSHTILEWSAFCVAIFTVILAFSHYKITNDVVTPIIGVAFFMAGCMDAFHTLAADRLIPAVADNRDLIPFTWAICRLFNALIMIAGVSILLLKPDKEEQHSSFKFIIGISVLFAMIAYLIIHYCATQAILPKTTFPDSIVTRPYDAVPLVLFAFSGLFIYPALYRKSPSLFTHALIISSIPQVVTQLHMTFGSTALFDNHFNIAHFMKIIAYLVPLIGLVLDYIKTHQLLQLEISERITAEESLRENERRWGFALESAKNGVWDLNAVTNEVFYSNSWKLLVGYDEHEFGNSLDIWQALIHVDERLLFDEKLQLLLAGKSINFDCEYRIRCKDGVYQWFLSKGKAIEHSTEGRVLRIIGTTSNINEKKQAEERLLVSEARQRTLVESVVDALITIDKLGIIGSFNQAAVRIFGYTVEEVLGKNVKMLMPQEIASKHDSILKNYVKTQRVNNVVGEVRELVAQRKNGDFFPIELAISEMRVGGDLHFVGIIRDITERKAIEAKVNKMISDMAAQTKEIQALNDFGDVLQSCLNLEEAYQVISRTLPFLIPDFSGGLYVFDKSCNSFVLLENWGEVAPKRANFALSDCMAIRRGGVYLSQVNQSALLCQHLEVQDNLVSHCLPLAAQGEVFGVIHLQGIAETETDSVLSVSSIFLSDIAKNISVVVASLKLKQELLEQSIQDPLTGLFNRRFMEASFEKELQQAKRKESVVLTYIMIDIDFFKKVNDTFGHEAGDYVLQSLGEILQQQTRKGDIACRFGGEEFALCLPDMPRELAVSRCEDIRKAMKSTQFEFMGKDMGSITISLGVAYYPEHGTSLDELMRKADNALYIAKEEGRDCVIVSPLSSTPA